MGTDHQKSGYQGANSGGDTLLDTLSDTLPKNGTFHWGNPPDRVSQGIYLVPKIPRDERAGTAVQEHSARKVFEIDALDTLIPCRQPTDLKSQPRTPRSSASARRAERRLKRRVAQAQSWWGAVPAPRPIYLYPADLEALIGTTMRRIAPALRALGWRHMYRAMQGKRRTVWLPPGSPVPERSQGRQPHFPCV